jgi:hypothetical protein
MTVILYKKPKLKDPIMIVGLPGIGNVAKIAADYLAIQLKTELFGEIYSDRFPAQILIEKDGCGLMRNELYYADNLIILIGNAQPIDCEGMYGAGYEILDVAKQLGVVKMITMAAYVSGYGVKEPSVFTAVTDPSLMDDLSEYGVTKMHEGTISGLNGLLIGMCRLCDIPGICLLGETDGRDLSDMRATIPLLRVLTKMLKIDISTDGLEKAEEVKSQLIAEEIKRREEKEKKIDRFDFTAYG